MKRYAPKIACRARHRRVPAFLPVPLRARADGWTPGRQADFLGALAETGSVLDAARRVSMARESAYRLRRKPGAESFAAAWDAVTGKVTPAMRKVTPEERMRRATGTLLKPHLYGGRHVATAEKVDDSALMAMLKRLDARRARRVAGPEGHRVSPARPGHIRVSRLDEGDTG